MTNFLYSPTVGAWMEVDHTRVDGTLPRRFGREHPDRRYWHLLRFEALRRDRFRCTLCNGKDRLEAHHRTYNRFGRELLEDIYCLCHACHQKFHSGTQAA